MLGCAWSHLEKLQKSRLGPLPSVSDSPGPEQGLRTAFLASFQLGPRSRPGTTLRASLESSFRAEDANWPRGSVWGRRWARKRTQGNICKNKMNGPKCLPVARDKDRASLFTGKSGDGPRSRLRGGWRRWLRPGAGAVGLGGGLRGLGRRERAGAGQPGLRPVYLLKQHRARPPRGQARGSS